MNASGEGNPECPENQNPPQPPESGLSRSSEAEASSASASHGATGSASDATEGLPVQKLPDLPPAAEMLRRASGSSVDSFSEEPADLSLLVAEQFQRR